VSYKVAITAVVAGLVAANGVLHLVDDSVVSQVLGLLAALGLYLLPSPFQPGQPGRTGTGWPNGMPFVVGGVLLLGTASPAAAQLPWRRHVEQRLQNLERQQQQQQAPAPQIIYLPYQQLPIQGEPRQTLPIQGPPLQQLPIAGPPKQQLPVPGAPQQQLPLQGAPQQQLPIPGPVPQQLPPQMPPATGLGTNPQLYTVIRALYRRAS
jgi:hypothetical protein